MNKNQSWLNSTVTRSTSVVPVHGFGMGDVRPMAAGYIAGTTTLKRHADAAAKATTPVSGFQPWSPPVT